MNKTMTLAIIAISLIVMASMFGIQLSPHAPIVVPAAAMGSALYVCPADTGSWAIFANALVPFRRYVYIGFLCCAMILTFSWGWALYQNLLKDKFERGAYTNAWKATKLLFWATVIFIIISVTPNHFRTVHVRGAHGEYVLCENTTPGARAVRATAVTK